MPRVLLVDDNLFLLPAVKASLEAAGHEVLHVSSLAGLEGLDASSAAAALVNFGSPRLDGAAVSARLRGDGGGPKIVGYGPHVDASLEERARAAGCSTCVPNGLVARNAARVVDKLLEGE